MTKALFSTPPTVTNAGTPEKPAVLLAATSCWYPTARLAMALAKAGCTVDSVCPSQHPVHKTQSVRQAHSYSGLSPLASFVRAIEKSRPDFIISGDDLATQHLHRLHARENLSPNSDSSVSALIERSFGNPASFPVMSSRAAFIHLAHEQGIRIPVTQVIHRLEDLEGCVARIGLPLVLKANGTSGGDGVRIAHTLADAERAFQQLQSPPLFARAAKRAVLDHDKTLLWPSLLRQRAVVNAQAFVAGCEATSAVLCWQGIVLASLHFEVIRKVSATGHATVVRSLQNNEMAIAVEGMAHCLGLSGLYGFDFMLEAGTGNAYLVEINPRATQVGHLSLGEGCDLPAALYATLSGNAVSVGGRLTEKDTIALFPQEWIRDPESSFLQSAYHDVPWNEAELVRDCVSKSRKQRAWYKRGARVPSFPPAPLVKAQSLTQSCPARPYAPPAILASKSAGRS